MSESQKPLIAYLFVDYIPAELRENKIWKVVYYVKNPITNKLIRKENRVKPLKIIALRRKLGQQMVSIINAKLQRGWSPFNQENNINGFAKFKDTKKIFLQRLEKSVKSEEKRPDTLRAYTSYLKNIEQFNTENNKEDMFVGNFNTDYIRKFLDYIHYERDNSARTRNNYLTFIKTFCEFLLFKKYISGNPTLRINKIQEAKKVRQIIPNEVLKVIFKELKTNDYEFYKICLIGYYCLIRRTELTKIKVSEIIIANGIIFVTAKNAKNKKSLPVTIPDVLAPILKKHIKDANSNDYLFGKGFLTGPQQLMPKKISERWDKLRKKINLPKYYQWYSLKDTGITDLLRAGIPTITVRDQARHYSVKQTEEYTPKEILKAVDSIKNTKINLL